MCSDIYSAAGTGYRRCVGNSTQNLICCVVGKSGAVILMPCTAPLAARWLVLMAADAIADGICLGALVVGMGIATLAGSLRLQALTPLCASLIRSPNICMTTHASMPSAVSIGRTCTVAYSLAVSVAFGIEFCTVITTGAVMVVGVPVSVHRHDGDCRRDPAWPCRSA